MSAAALRDTGERVVPDWVRDDDRLAVVFLEQHLRRYQRAAELAAGRRVLDAGCGAGYGARMLAAAGAADVVAVDVSPAAIVHARERYGGPGVAFRVGQVDSLPAGAFDLVTCFEVVEHVPDPPAFLGHLRRVLADGGRLLVSASVYPTTNLYRFHLRDYTAPSFTEEVTSAGFSVESTFGQSQHIEAGDVRRSAIRHWQSFPVGRLVRRPMAVLRDVWRSQVSGGLTHENLMLTCVVADGQG